MGEDVIMQRVLPLPNDPRGYVVFLSYLISNETMYVLDILVMGL